MASWEIAIIMGLIGFSFLMMYASRALGENFNNKVDALIILVKFLLVISSLAFLFLIPLASVQIITANNGTNWATVNQTLITTPYKVLETGLAGVVKVYAFIFIFMAILLGIWFVLSMILTLFKGKENQ